ncbi:MAG TPA: RNA polymerase sigma factor [Polyangiaceae bacterium]|nr:RNA polymerase sigma factor [Polyangiaceae bacterium]
MTGRGQIPEPQPEQTDALLPIARAAIAGDSAAVRTFLVSVGPHLLRVVRRVLGSEHPDVDDVVQESAFAVMDALPRHRGDSTVLHFVCRVAVLTAMNARRRDGARKRASTRDDREPIEAFASDSPGPDQALLTRASVMAVRELMDSLPLEQAEVLALHCVLGHTVPEIATAAGVPQETVRSRLRLAKLALRKRVQGDPRLENLLEETS